MTWREYHRMKEEEMKTRRFRTNVELRNRGGFVIPRGRIVEVTRKFGGLHIRSKRLGGSIKKVSPLDVEMLPL